MSFNPEYFYPSQIVTITNLNGGITVPPTPVKASDVYAAVDVTNVTSSPSGTANPYQIASLLNFILGTLGFTVYPPVLASTTIDLNANYNNGISGVGATLTNAGAQAAFTTDGQTGILNGLYLIGNQAIAATNGLYTLTNIGSNTTNWVLTRYIGFNSSSNIKNNGLVYVLYGSANGATLWQDTFSGSIIVGSTPINYGEYSLIGVGQVISSTVLYASAVTFTTSTLFYNITSITLTPGTWEISSNYFINNTSGQLTAVLCNISTHSATPADNAFTAGINYGGSGTLFYQIGGAITPLTVSISTNTTYYLVGSGAWGSGSTTGCGFIQGVRIA